MKDNEIECFDISFKTAYCFDAAKDLIFPITNYDLSNKYSNINLAMLTKTGNVVALNKKIAKEDFYLLLNENQNVIYKTWFDKNNTLCFAKDNFGHYLVDFKQNFENTKLSHTTKYINLDVEITDLTNAETQKLLKRLNARLKTFAWHRFFENYYVYNKNLYGETENSRCRYKKENFYLNVKNFGKYLTPTTIIDIISVLCQDECYLSANEGKKFVNIDDITPPKIDPFKEYVNEVLNTHSK